MIKLTYQKFPTHFSSKPYFKKLEQTNLNENC